MTKDRASSRIAVVGVGKIARDQHLPAIARDAAFDAVATVDPLDGVDGIPNFATLDALLADGPAIDAVAVCTPPAIRAGIVATAFAAGLHVMVEKPPATALDDVSAMRSRAVSAGRTLFAAWHSREAGGVAAARDWLVGKRIDRVDIAWREDIRRWHPGQDWILDDGGFGVFDPGINALSILTVILPDPITLISAHITVPVGRRAPIAARLAMEQGTAPITATFDFLQPGPQVWNIAVETEAGRLMLREGGSVLVLDGATRRCPDQEYPRLYRRFADLIAAGQSEADATPLDLVLRALQIADCVQAPPFDW